MDALEFLARLRQRLLRVIGLDGCGRLLAWSLVGFMGFLILDRLQPLPPLVRLLVLVAGVVGISLVALRRLVRPLRQDLSDMSLARIAERRLPALNGHLFAAVDGLPLSETERQQLQARCNHEAIRQMIRTDSMRFSSVSALVMVLVLVVTGLVNQQLLSVGAQRLFMPFGSAVWPKSRTIVAQLRAPIVASDQPLVVEASLERGGPTRLVVNWQDALGQSEQRVAEGLEGPWREALNLPPGDYKLHVHAEDANEVYLSGQVVSRPSLRQMDAVLTPPAYTGKPAQEIEGVATLTALKGSAIDLRFLPRLGHSTADQQVVLRWLGQDVSLEKDADGAYSGRITITEDGELQLSLQDRYGDVEQQLAIPARPEPRFAVTALSDAKPVVALQGVRNNEQVTKDAKLDLVTHAKDDIGLKELRLQAVVTQVEAGDADGQPGAAETEQVITVFGDVDGAVVTERRHQLLVGDVARRGQRLALQARAVDGNDYDGPGIGLSETLSLVVVSAEQLRQELDRILDESRDRIAQARENLAAGRNDAERRSNTARSARALARRAGEQLHDVVRRWAANDLEADSLPVLRDADAALQEPDVAGLGQLDGSDADLDRIGKADKALGKAEALLDRLLASGDLARQLGSLLKRQLELNKATKTFLGTYLGGQLDGKGERQQADLSSMQLDLSKRVKDWEKRLLSTDSQHFEQARDLVRSQQPAGLLDQAGRSLAEANRMARAPKHQREGTDILRQLLDSLRGADRDQQLAGKIGALAARQREIKERIENGERPQDVAPDQDALNEDTKAALEEVKEETDNDEAAESMTGAVASQNEAGKSMQGGKAEQSASAAESAASLLDEARRRLEGKDKQDGDQDKDKKKNKDTADVIALLRALLTDQRKVVTKSINLHTALVERFAAKGGHYTKKDLGFRDKRPLAEVSSLQEEILLRLREDGLKHLDEMPIAKRALERVDKAMERSFKHLDKPDLGQRGVQLGQRALYELERLLDVVDTMPEPQTEEGGQQGQGPNPNGNQNQPPFPPRAQLALLMADQQYLRWLTAANHPSALDKQQAELLELAEMVAQQTRPGTRPHVLMQRVLRAMASAHELLEQKQRGAVVLDEEDASVAALYRILEEQRRQANSSQNQPQNNQQRRGNQNKGQSKRSGSEGSSGQGAQAKAGQEGKSGQEGNGDGDGTLVETKGLPSWAIQLPPRDQEAILRAQEDNVPAESLLLYRRYRELLRESER